MTKAIQQLPSGLVVGRAGLGSRNGIAESVRQQVHDGDTVNVRMIGNFGVRFLGVDAPEISFSLPGENRFRALSHPLWEEFLTDPFADRYPPFQPPIPPGLREHIAQQTGPGTARNHDRHARAAEHALEEEIRLDLDAMGKTEEDFEFFLAFAYEILDRYGRLLCFLNRHQPRPDHPGPRPPDYNGRLLTTGNVSPYFIWPNINPFRKKESLMQAVPPPGRAADWAREDSALRTARQAVRRCRESQIGIFEPTAPLRLQPFEVRFLARRQTPNRWVIDLGSGEEFLLPPEEYYRILNLEDRLFIPEEFIPLFVAAGWKKSSPPLSACSP